MAVALRLGVLDQCPVPQGSSAADAVAATLELAVAVEAFGFGRYWLAEHHNTPTLAATSPEILMAAVAARTSTIRVGSGGVLLSHYSPLKVAETFRLLDALHPGRIELGVGRAAGADPAAEAALAYRADALGDDYFPERVLDLLGFLDGELEEGHPYTGVRAMPLGDSPPVGPPVWVLGSSSKGAACAAYLGLPFAFAQFITADFGPQVVKSYRKGFRPSTRAAAPQAMVAVPVICAPTDAEAERLAASVDVWLLRSSDGGERGPLLPPDEAAAVRVTSLQREKVTQNRKKLVIGTPAQVAERLTILAEEFGVEELLVLTVCHDPADRLRSYELLAQVVSSPE